MQAHAPVPGHARRRLRVHVGQLAFARLDPIAKPAPAFATPHSRGDAGSERRCCQLREERLIAGEWFRTVLTARFDQSLDPTSGPGQYPRHLVCAGRGRVRKRGA
jgi:hypothetical protein